MKTPDLPEEKPSAPSKRNYTRQAPLPMRLYSIGSEECQVAGFHAAPQVARQRGAVR